MNSECTQSACPGESFSSFVDICGFKIGSHIHDVGGMGFFEWQVKGKDGDLGYADSSGDIMSSEIAVFGSLQLCDGNGIVSPRQSRLHYLLNKVRVLPSRLAVGSGRPRWPTPENMPYPDLRNQIRSFS
ncbi:hypothetical protein V1520DRAFT_12849 [Lipomyces starkeyi]